MINNKKVSLGVVILAAPGEPLGACLSSIEDDVDEIVVFTWDVEQERVARAHSARVIMEQPVTHVELIRQKMQGALQTDWVLMMDPDESVESQAINRFRWEIGSAGENVVGFWIPYRMMFLGQELRHSFHGLWQMRLFRRNRVQYSSTIHQVPEPLAGHYVFLQNGPGIEHHFVIHLLERFERHLKWAGVEAATLAAQGDTLIDPLHILQEGMDEFLVYVIEREGLKDGTRGLINALLHGWKRMAGLMLLWELQGAKNVDVDSTALVAVLASAIDRLHESRS